MCRTSSPSFFLGLAVGGRVRLSPSTVQSVLLPPAGHMLGDTVGSLLQRTDPVPATCQSSTSLSIIPNKDAEGFPSWWRASLLPGLLDTPSQVCLPLHDTLLPLSHFIHEWERLPGVSLWVHRTIRSDLGRGLVCHYRPKGCIFSHPGRSATQEVPSVCLWREGLPIQGPALRSGLGAENIHKMHGCCTGPFEAPGHSCTELSGRLAHSGSLQGASESSQGYRSPPHPFSWPQNERQEECAPPISANRVSGGSFGFHSDAGPFGSCPDIQFYSMSGPLQTRPSCLCRYLPQAVRPHGSGLPCVAPRVASHEAVPLVDERAEVTPHCTSYLPYQGVAQLLSTPFTMAGPRFSPERSENGCDPPSPYDHDGHINDGLWRGLRRQTGELGMDRRVPFLAHKLPGTQSCLPGFDVFSPRSRGASYHSQNRQYGGCVPHKPAGGFTVPWRILVLRQDAPLRTLLSGFTTLTLIRLQVLRSCLFEPTVCCWFFTGPDRQRF